MAKVNAAVETGKVLDANPENRAISTYTGRVFDITNPETWDFTLDDIAPALANICRYAGHVDFYSVAEHSIRVATILNEWGHPPAVCLLGLLHDASEAYLLDIPRPWKPLVYIGDRTYYDVENDIQESLFKQFGIYDTYQANWDAVHEADMQAYREEASRRPRVSEFPDTVTTKHMARIFKQIAEGLLGSI